MTEPLDLDKTLNTQQSARPNLKSLLLEPGARFEKLILERGHLKRRPPMDFK